MEDIVKTVRTILTTYTDTGLEVREGPYPVTIKGTPPVIALPNLNKSADPMIREEVMVFGGHEGGHVEYPADYGTKSSSLHMICNVIDDVRIDRLNAEKRKGFGRRQGALMIKYVAEKTNASLLDPKNPAFKKLCDITYFRGVEKFYGKMPLKVPADLEKLWQDKIGYARLDRIAALRNESKIGDKIRAIAEEILGKMKEDMPEPPPQSSQGQGKQKKQSKSKSTKKEKQQDEEDQTGDAEPEDTDEGTEAEDTDKDPGTDNDIKEDKDAGDVNNDQADDTDGKDKADDTKSAGSDESGDQDKGSDDISGNSAGKSDPGTEEADKDSEDSDGGTKSDKDESEKEDEPSKGSSNGHSDDNNNEEEDDEEEDAEGEDEESDGDKDGKEEQDSSEEPEGDEDESKGSSGTPQPPDPLAEQLKQEATDGIDEGTIYEDFVKEISQYTDTNHIYRTDPSVKDIVYKQNERIGWQEEIRQAETLGQSITGYMGHRIKSLFVSEIAPKWTNAQRTGRLNVRKLWNDDSDYIFRKKLPGRREDAAVSLVIDNSGSMKHNDKNDIATALLVSLSGLLDDLRIPFECMGFTTEEQNSSEWQKNAVGIRTKPIHINLIKEFEEPYRRVRHRFVWPSRCDCTLELPCIQYAAGRLAQRRETKKVLFIISDGVTETSHPILDAAARRATAEYVLMLEAHDMIVVGFGIQDRSIQDYCSKSTIISNLDEFGKKMFGELQNIMVRG